ncbi:hypothetical protein PIROE2DRAFT_6932, partial [Piromyces sp. E2]
EIIFNILRGKFEIDKKSSAKDQKNDKKILTYIRNFYNSCIDTDLMDKQGNQPLLTFLDQLKLNDRNYNDTAILSNTIAELHNYDVGTLFNMELAIPPSKSDNKNYILSITENSGTFDNYEDSESVDIYRKEIKAILSIVYGNRKDKNIDKMIEAIIKFEKKISLIANKHVFIEEDYDDNTITYQDLIKKYPFINWKLYFKKRYETIIDNFNDIPKNVEILLFPSEYFEELNKAFTKTDTETIAIYLEW